MSEVLQTRSEHSRSLEDAEKYRAIQTLTELGMLVPFSEASTFHGRIGSSLDAEEWSVDPSFKNGGNDSGNGNINNRPTLYTGEEGIAKDFALARAGEIISPGYDEILRDKIQNYTPEQKQEWFNREQKLVQERWDAAGEDGRGFLQDPATYSPKDLYKWKEARRLDEKMPAEEKDDHKRRLMGDKRAEVHKIVTTDVDATVVDLVFDATKLEEQDVVRYKEALMALIRQTPVTEGSPVDFNDRSAVGPVVEAIKARKKSRLLNSEVEAIAKEAGVNYQVALQITSAFNSAHIMRDHPNYLISRLLNNSHDLVTDALEVDGKPEELTVNLEYVQRFLRNAHIIGVRQVVSSATLNRSVPAVSLFDLEKVNTDIELESERGLIAEKLGGMATLLGGVIEPKHEFGNELSFRSLLASAYVKPQKLVQAARQVDGYNDIFDADAGNWEGYTLAEHTETVLRNFDENFADKIPVELLPVMRLAIITHDLGKPESVASRSKYLEKEYNARQASDFLNKIGLDEAVKILILAMIGDGSQLAFQINIQGNRETAVSAMEDLARATLGAFHSDQIVPQAEIRAFSEMCKMLQLCDGGAYTSMAVTRTADASGNAVRYRNAPSFNSSFTQPHGFGKRTLKLRGNGEKPALTVLTPQAKN